jgi:FkbM family methyltransferase
MLNTVKFILSHPLNRGRPLSTLARYASWQIRSRLHEEVVFDWIEGTKLVARNGMTGATGNIYCGLHEYADMSFVLHLLRPGDLFVDVGANIGSYTILASGVCGARSVAIEPDPGTVRHLERNIAANRLEDSVDLKMTAVGEETGMIAFTTGLDTMNRVAVAEDRDAQTVPLARLDDLLDGCAPVLIKMDVEGFETPALRGAEGTLSSPSLLAIMLETVDDEAHAQLMRHGFEKFGYEPGLHMLIDPGLATGSNLLFVRGRAKVEERLASAPRRMVSGSYV